MTDTTWGARFGVLVVGMVTAVAPTGAAWVATPVPPVPDLAVSADGMALAAATDFQISIWGFEFGTPGGTADANATFGNIAMAFGDNAYADATGGFFSFASASGASSIANAQAASIFDIFNFASAFGANSLAVAGHGSFDVANAIGDSSVAEAGRDGSVNFANAIGDFSGAHAGGGSFNVASAFGFDSSVTAGFNGSFDVASAVGANTNAFAGIGTPATPAFFDIATVWGNLFAPTINPTVASAIDGNNDVAFVFNPFGILGSSALAGFGGFDFDLAGVFGDNLNALSNGADFVWHILPFF